MIKEQLVYKIQSKMLKICEERFGTTKCNAACNECAFKKFTDYMIEELEDYY